MRLAAAQRLNNEADIWVCVQDTFSDFYLQRNRFDPSKGSLRGYLVTISTRKAIRQWRENQRQWLASQASPAEADDIGAWERREQVNQARPLPGFRNWMRVSCVSSIMKAVLPGKSPPGWI